MNATGRLALVQEQEIFNTKVDYESRPYRNI